MSTLEREIIDRFRRLSPDRQARVLSTLQDEARAEHMTLDAWLAEAETVRINLRPDASGYVPSASDLVNEAREERDANILVVLDSGILLATVQTEVYTEQAKALIASLAQAQSQMVAPVLLRYELVAVTRKWVYRDLTTPDAAARALNTLLHYPVTLHFDEALLKRGYELATAYPKRTTP